MTPVRVLAILLLALASAHALVTISPQLRLSASPKNALFMSLDDFHRPRRKRDM